MSEVEPGGKLSKYTFIEIEPGLYAIEGGEEPTKEEMLIFIQRFIEDAPNEVIRATLMEAKARIENGPELRDVSHIKEVMPLSGAILQRIEQLNYQFKLRHPKSSFQDALKSPDLTGQVMLLLPLFITIGLPEMALAHLKYVANGIKNGQW